MPFCAFQLTYYLLSDAGAEAAGEQGEHYDPLFTYGTETSSFAHPEESEGDAADIGPSGAGASKGSPVASSSIGWSTGYSASESGSAIRVDSAKNFPMERMETDAADEMFETISCFGIVSTSWLLLHVVSRLTTVLLQVFGLKMHQLQESQKISPKGHGVT